MFRIHFCLPGVDGIVDLGLPYEDPNLEPADGDKDGDLNVSLVGSINNELTRIYKPF